MLVEFGFLGLSRWKILVENRFDGVSMPLQVLFIYFRFGEYSGFDSDIYGSLTLQVLIYLFGVYWI